jgi:alkanesulfonate monooxygenase SsuD/methylene tetrahydromethanopterin reductase-like flavin-dependent oxidoreductase (luciferase family)
MILGAGVGWWEQEFEVLGVPFEKRGARMDECLQLVRSLWTDEWVNFKGEFYECVDWTCNPKPAQPGGIPIWLGGESKGQLRRVGKYADGWLATLRSVPKLKEDFAIAQEAAVKAGRDPSQLIIAVEGAGILQADRLEQAAEGLGRLREMGVHHAILGVHPREMANARPLLEAFGSKYLAAARG